MCHARVPMRARRLSEARPARPASRCREQIEEPARGLLRELGVLAGHDRPLAAGVLEHVEKQTSRSAAGLPSGPVMPRMVQPTRASASVGVRLRTLGAVAAMRAAANITLWRSVCSRTISSRPRGRWDGHDVERPVERSAELLGNLGARVRRPSTSTTPPRSDGCSRHAAASAATSAVATIGIVLRSREMTDMLAAVTSGLGLGVLPCYLGDADPVLVRLTRQPVASSKLSLVYRREARLARPIRAVADLVVAAMQRQAPRLLGRR